MKVIINENKELQLIVNNEKIVYHSPEKPFIFVGKGNATFDMYRGNYDIKDYVIERVGLTNFEIIDKNKIKFFRENEFLVVNFEEKNGRTFIKLLESSNDLNRYWFRIVADKEEKIYGCGEQMSYFNLRGKNFPLWTSEPGVGRNKKTYTTWQADVKDRAGGDYYTTYYPQPTFVSTKKYYLHMETTAYADFDFRNEEFHELQVWHKPEFIMIEAATTYLELIEKLTDYFGRQPKLPEWVYNGVLLGIQGGTDLVIEKMNKAIEAGVEVAGLWCQDWEGINITSFGKRLWWDWKWSPETYPELDKKIWELKAKGIRFLGYMNPFFVENDTYYNEAEAKGYLAKDQNGNDYKVDFGEFNCGIVDFTNTEAFEWYKEKIKKELIEFGLDGWMADFGEYLPSDAVLKNGTGELMHNAWPVLWAKANYEAIKETGNLEKIVYFMRAGYTGNQKYCTLMWAGDQCVDWCIDDGLASVIVGALSVGMVGNALTHSDIGGYTTLHGLKRSKELFMRWAEMGAFTPFMRTHEGNRPSDNHQFDTDIETLKHFARMTKIYKKLVPYTKDIVNIASEKGIPVQRPLFMHYEEDKETYEIKYQYLYGEDILVAPVYNKGETIKEVYLPKDEWIHVWTGQEFKGGYINIEVPIGYPAVFYRKSSPYKSLFEELKNI
ncbi:alpha-glucosidase [Fusobacterium sp.]|uniref:alpha-glucosidase n=1 Tax=Fusobacterium sp. TaxID=68766 RepID=UPI00260A03A8|nr:alpha-glucosidase [Fusobacterium sp.]